MGAALITGLDKFQRYCEKMASEMREPQAVAKRVGAYGVSSTQKRIRSNIPPPNAPLTVANKKGHGTLRDTGALMNSITHKTGSTWAAWGSNITYARIHNEGGVIVPVNAKRLAIPAGWNARTLMRRYGETPRQCISGMKSAGYSVWRSKSGKALMSSGKDGKPFVLFILRESVTIPKRQYIDFDNEDQVNVLDMVEAWIAQI